MLVTPTPTDKMKTGPECISIPAFSSGSAPMRKILTMRGLQTVPRVALLLFVFFSQGLSPEKEAAEQRCLKQCSTALSASAVCLCVRYGVCVCGRTCAFAASGISTDSLLPNSAPGIQKGLSSFEREGLYSVNS